MIRKTIETPVGRLLLSAGDGKLCGVYPAQAYQTCIDDSDPVLDQAQQQIMQYFAGVRAAFDLPLAMEGSAFERAVWQQLCRIPFGEIRTYGQIAAALGMPGAARAVGGACSRNPLLIVVPCHRVIAGTGKLTGFAAGMPVKRALLTLEGWHVVGDRVRAE